MTNTTPAPTDDQRRAFTDATINLLRTAASLPKGLPFEHQAGELLKAMDNEPGEEHSIVIASMPNGCGTNLYFDDETYTMLRTRLEQELGHAA
jgi:hypothetical protein